MAVGSGMEMIHPVSGREWSLGTVAPADDEERLLLGAQSGVIRPAENPFRGMFGMTRSDEFGNPKFHSGIDLAAIPGEAVFACADGVVARYGEQKVPPGGFGLRVYLRHKPSRGQLKNQGDQTVYAHLSGFNAELGWDRGYPIRAGYLIGWAGFSGNATGEECHVHFGVKVGGSWVDPLEWVRENS